MKYETYHFDMDGVIADTEPLHSEAGKQTCLDFDLDIDTVPWNEFKGRTAEAIFAHLRENSGNVKTPAIEELIRHNTNLFVEMAWERGLEPVEGSLDFIKWVRKRANTVTLVTSSNRLIKNAILKYFNIQKMFDIVVTGDNVTNGKPHPEPYLLALDISGANPATSLVFEDSKSGVISASKAGCDVMAITTTHSEAELREVNPTYIIDNYMVARSIITAANK